MVLWYFLHTCYRCSGRPVCWGAGYKLVACWCPQHTDTERHTAPETDASPLGRLESPSKTHREERWGEEEHGWLRWFINWDVSCFCVCQHTSSVSNMVRLEEKGELVLSLNSQWLSKKAAPRSLMRPGFMPLRPAAGPWASPPRTRTDILFTKTWGKLTMSDEKE